MPAKKTVIVISAAKMQINSHWEKRQVQVYSAAKPSMPVDHPVFLPTYKLQMQNRCPPVTEPI